MKPLFTGVALCSMWGALSLSLSTTVAQTNAEKASQTQKVMPKGSLTESKELISNPFFYDFEGGKPTHWETQGTVAELEPKYGYNTDTGKALSITTNDTEGYIKQVIDLAKSGAEVTKGDEVEATIHYFTEESQRAEGPFRLACRWLNSAGEEIKVEESVLMNNDQLYFGRRKAYGEFKFRTICPEGAVKFEYMLRVDAHSSVRVDDLGLSLLPESERKPFVSFLPQYGTIEAELNKEKSMPVAFQGMHLEKSIKATYQGFSGFKLAEETLPEGNKTIATTLSMTPSKKGVFLMNKAGKCVVSFQASESLSAAFTPNIYVIDAENKPKVALKAEPEEMVGEPGSSLLQTLEFEATGIIDHVNIALEQETHGAFRINTTQLFYSATKDMLLNNTVKLTFAPKSTGDFSATLVVKSTMAEDLRIPIKGRAVKASGETISEKFSADNALDSRFQGRPEWTGYHRFDRGYWLLDGTWDEKGKITLKANGLLAYDEYFVNGLKELTVTPAAAAASLKLQFSVDGGGHWLEGKAPNGATFAVEAKRPTLVRLVNTTAEPLTLNEIAFVPYDEAVRLKFKSIEEAMIKNADKEALSLLNENFNSVRHTRTLGLNGWQNIIVSADIPAAGWHQKDVQSGEIEEMCARMGFMKFGQEDSRPHQTWLISPTLSWANAASKILTFRLRYQTPTTNGEEKFGLHLLIEEGGAVKTFYIDLTTLLPVGVNFEKDQWLDFLVDLSQINGVAIEDRFHVAFSLDSPVGGNATSLNFLIDDVTFGRNDIPVVNVDKDMITLNFKPGMPAQPQTFTVTTERANAPIDIVLVPRELDGAFILDKKQLPQEGGVVAVGFKSDAPTNRAAALLVQMRGAASRMVKLLANYANALDELDNNSLRLFPTATDGTLYAEGYYDGYAIFDTAGQLVASGEAARTIDVSALPTGRYIVRLVIEGVGYKPFVIERL